MNDKPEKFSGIDLTLLIAGLDALEQRQKAISVASNVARQLMPSINMGFGAYFAGDPTGENITILKGRLTEMKLATEQGDRSEQQKILREAMK